MRYYTIHISLYILVLICALTPNKHYTIAAQEYKTIENSFTLLPGEDSLTTTFKETIIAKRKFVAQKICKNKQTTGLFLYFPDEIQTQYKLLKDTSAFFFNNFLFLPKPKDPYPGLEIPPRHLYDLLLPHFFAQTIFPDIIYWRKAIESVIAENKLNEAIEIKNFNCNIELIYNEWGNILQLSFRIDSPSLEPFSLEELAHLNLALRKYILLDTAFDERLSIPKRYYARAFYSFDLQSLFSNKNLNADTACIQFKDLESDKGLRLPLGKIHFPPRPYWEKALEEALSPQTLSLIFKNHSPQTTLKLQLTINQDGVIQHIKSTFSSDIQHIIPRTEQLRMDSTLQKFILIGVSFYNKSDQPSRYQLHTEYTLPLDRLFSRRSNFTTPTYSTDCPTQWPYSGIKRYP